MSGPRVIQKHVGLTSAIQWSAQRTSHILQLSPFSDTGYGGSDGGRGMVWVEKILQKTAPGLNDQVSINTAVSWHVYTSGNARAFSGFWAIFVGRPSSRISVSAMVISLRPTRPKTGL